VERLKAEGFVAAADATSELVSKPVQLSVNSAETLATYQGTIVFVSPEVDPITGQVRVWAVIDNRNGRLRPGQPAKMIVK
jgi:macrolide-specific efflux system membrane fusion protein